MERGSVSCAVLLAVTALAAAPACRERHTERRERPIAKIDQLSGSVDLRRSRKLSWASATLGMDLFHRDALKTGGGSSARVAFRGGGALEIGESALVIIEAPQRDRAADAPRVARVERGTVRGTARPGAAPITVTTPSGRKAVIAAVGAKAVPFRVRVRQGKLEVAVLGGKAEVRAGGKKVLVARRQLVDVAEKPSAPLALLPYPELLEPAVDATVVPGEVALRWDPVRDAHSYRVQISNEMSFARRLVDERVSSIRFVMKRAAPESKLFWRIASVDIKGHEGEFGYARRFTVATRAPEPATQPATQPATLLAPAAGANVLVGQVPLFRWGGDAEATYELVISRRRSLKRGIVYRKRLKGTQYGVKLRRGRYFWGVYRLEGRSRKPLFKRARRLEIVRRGPPRVKVPRAIRWK